MPKFQNIQNRDLYDEEKAGKRHTPPDNPADNAPKDGIKSNQRQPVQSTPDSEL
ncbi:MAG: hypothetical protein FWE91_04105 [Defluviitaleaceae bacterium]|nr:hypothetical protein [Defluviitaleaceae bacterium]